MMSYYDTFLACVGLETGRRCSTPCQDPKVMRLYPDPTRRPVACDPGSIPPSFRLHPSQPHTLGSSGLDVKFQSQTD